MGGEGGGWKRGWRRGWVEKGVGRKGGGWKKRLENKGVGERVKKERWGDDGEWGWKKKG